MLNSDTGVIDQKVAEQAPANTPIIITPQNTSAAETSIKCSLDDLLSEMEQPRENVNEGKDVIEQKPSFVPDAPSSIKKETLEEKGLREKRARWEARFLANNNDKLHAFICSIIAMDEDMEDYKCTAEEIKDLENEIFEMRKDSTSHLPPWIGVLIGMLLMYGPKYKDALQDRRANKALIEKAARAEADRLVMMELYKKQQRQHSKTESPEIPEEKVEQKQILVNEKADFKEMK